MIHSRITTHPLDSFICQYTNLSDNLKMKFFVVVILLAALIAAALANIAPTPPSHCDYRCNPADVPVYASNGRCFLKFPSTCSLQKYNCLNPQKAFREVSQLQYSADAAPKCQTKDY